MSTERPNEIVPDATFEFEALRHANNYRATLIREFGPFLKGGVIEIGAGIGQVTEMIAKHAGVEKVIGVEPDDRFCAEFRKRLPDQPLIHGTIEAVDRQSPWNAIVSVNVLEHIRDDERELKLYADILRAQHGHLCLFVPARQEIYAPLDQDFGHFRRYARPELRAKLEQAGFEIVRLDYFNWVGYFAWWFNFCLLKKRNFDVGAVKFFDGVILPVNHWLESRVCRPPFGQSLIAIARAR